MRGYLLCSVCGTDYEAVWGRLHRPWAAESMQLECNTWCVARARTPVHMALGNYIFLIISIRSGATFLRYFQSWGTPQGIGKLVTSRLVRIFCTRTHVPWVAIFWGALQVANFLSEFGRLARRPNIGFLHYLHTKRPTYWLHCNALCWTK